MREGENYLEYLYKFGFEDDRHWRLARYLHSLPFDWKLDRDENRMYDGLDMRKEFEEDTGDTAYVNDEWGVDSCTMLEFFVGFAHRLSRDMFTEIDCQGLVSAMLDNLGMWEYDDIKMCDEDMVPTTYFDEIMDDLSHNRYSADGEGGLFPLKEPFDDMRKVEMWRQASWWYNENYPE